MNFSLTFGPTGPGHPIGPGIPGTPGGPGLPLNGKQLQQFVQHHSYTWVSTADRRYGGIKSFQQKT